MIKFDGLHKLLAYNHFCYIKVSSQNGEEKIIEVIERKLILEKNIMTEVSDNIFAGLTNLSNKIEFKLLLSDEETVNYESTLIDKLVENGYSLHFYRLPNFQILSTICSGNTKDEYIPVKSVITSDVKTGFITLNESLKRIPQDKFIFNFKNEIHNHEESVREYQKTLNKYHY